MKAVLVTYDKEAIAGESLVTVDDTHDFANGPYQDTVHFSVGSNQSIVTVARASERFRYYLATEALPEMMEALEKCVTAIDLNDELANKPKVGDYSAREAAELSAWEAAHAALKFHTFTH